MHGFSNHLIASQPSTVNYFSSTRLHASQLVEALYSNFGETKFPWDKPTQSPARTILPDTAPIPWVFYPHKEHVDLNLSSENSACRWLFFWEKGRKGRYTHWLAGSWVLSGLRGTLLCWWTIWYLSTNYSLHIFNFEQAPNLTCKIPKSASPGAYILHRPFWGGLYTEEKFAHQNRPGLHCVGGKFTSPNRLG